MMKLLVQSDRFGFHSSSFQISSLDTVLLTFDDAYLTSSDVIISGQSSLKQRSIALDFICSQNSDTSTQLNPPVISAILSKSISVDGIVR